MHSSLLEHNDHVDTDVVTSAPFRNLCIIYSSQVKVAEVVFVDLRSCLLLFHSTEVTIYSTCSRTKI
jgi:hypothetical protein